LHLPGISLWSKEIWMSSAVANEAELITRILAGEKELFHELIRPYERMAYLTCYSVLRNPTDAEDAAQEAVINAYRHLASFRGEAKFSTWLVTIATNEARKRLRRARVAKEEPIALESDEMEGDYTPAFLTDWREIPSEVLERSEVREQIRRAVGELPDIYREVFTLRDVDELNVEETARALGTNANVVKVRLHRARMLLQKKLVPILQSAAPARRNWFWRRS